MTVGRLLATQLLAALLLGGCVGVETGPSKAETEAAAARVVADATAAQAAAEQSGTIHIGVAGPMSGDLAVFGEQLQRGAEMAVRDINAAGGVLGRTLTLDIADDHCSAREDADNAANDLVAKGVVFVDGHFCSGSSIRGSKIYAPANVLQITPSSSNALLTDTAAQSKITTLLRVVGRDEMQADFAADWLTHVYAGQPIVVVSDNSLYGKGIAARHLAGLKDRGVTPVLNASFAQGQTSYGNLVAKLKEIKPSALYVAAYHDDIGRLVWAMRASRWRCCAARCRRRPRCSMRPVSGWSSPRRAWAWAWPCAAWPRQPSTSVTVCWAISATSCASPASGPRSRLCLLWS